MESGYQLIVQSEDEDKVISSFQAEGEALVQAIQALILKGSNYSCRVAFKYQDSEEPEILYQLEFLAPGELKIRHF